MVATKTNILAIFIISKQRRKMKNLRKRKSKKDFKEAIAFHFIKEMEMTKNLMQ